MALRNRTKTNDSFDLDSYLEEKSTEGFSSETQPPVEEKKPSNFFRNLTLVVVAGLASVMWYYDWNPRAAISGIFGNSDAELIATTESARDNVLLLPPGNSPSEIVVLGANGGEDILIVPPTSSGTADDPIIIDMGELNGFDSESITRLTEESVALGLEAAFAALEGLQTGLEGLEGLESLEELEGFEVSMNESLNEDLDGLGATINESIARAFADAFSSGEFTSIEMENNANSLPDFDTYSSELIELNSNLFDNEAIEKLYQTGVPVSFIQKMDDASLLTQLGADGVIRIFEEVEQ